MKASTAKKLTAANAAAIAAFIFMLAPDAAVAAGTKNPVAVFSGLDKITGRTTSFDVYVDETVQFGALQVTPRVCYTHDEAEAQKVDAFVEVDEITLDRKIRRIFTGWMFAASPGLNAVDHPIYDVWLTGCKMSSDVPAPNETKAQAEARKNAEQAKPADEGQSQPQTDSQTDNGDNPDATENAPALDPNVDIGVGNDN